MSTPALPFNVRLVIATVCFICLAYLGTVMWGSSARISITTATPVQGITPYITNKTNGLRVVSVKTVGEGSRIDIEVTLLNQSSKNIMAYVVSTGSVSMTAQIGIDREPFAPGQVRVEKIPYNNVVNAAENNPSRAGEIVLAAVYSSDGTGDGEPQWVNRIKNKHLGMKDEVKFVLPLLRSTLDSPESDFERALLALESQVLELPTREENDKLSFDYKDGRSFVKEGLKANIKLLKSKKKASPSLNHRDELNEMITHYERFLAAL